MGVREVVQPVHLCDFDCNQKAENVCGICERDACSIHISTYFMQWREQSNRDNFLCDLCLECVAIENLSKLPHAKKAQYIQDAFRERKRGRNVKAQDLGRWK